MLSNPSSQTTAKVSDAQFELVKQNNDEFEEWQRHMWEERHGWHPFPLMKVINRAMNGMNATTNEVSDWCSDNFMKYQEEMRQRHTDQQPMLIQVCWNDGDCIINMYGKAS